MAPAALILPFVRAAAELARGLTRIWVPALVAGTGGDRGGDAAPSTERRRARRAELRRDLWKLRRAYAEATSDRALPDLLAMLGRVAARGGGIRRTVVAWVAVIEILVQEEERRALAGTPLSGARKKREVKAALVHLFLRAGRRGGRTPLLIEPLVYEAVADVSIDAVVLLLDRNGLWKTPAPPPGALRRRARRLRHLLARPFAPLRAWLAALILHRVLSRHRVPPELAKKLDEAAEVTRVGDFLAVGAELAGWVARHRPQVIAMVEIVSFTVQEAEGMLRASGAEKKAYACDLILIFLEDEGLIPVAGLWRPLAESLVGALIDAIVRIFHRRGLFRSSSP